MDKSTEKNNGEKRGRAEDVFYFSVATASIGILVYTWLQPWAYLRTMDGLSLAAFPTVFIALLLIASISGLIFKKRQKESSKQPTKEERFLFWPVMWLSGGVVAGTFGLWNLDPVITSGALVLLLLLVAAIRDWRLLVGLPIGMGLLIYILFIRVLGVYFPHGWFS